MLLRKRLGLRFSIRAKIVSVIVTLAVIFFLASNLILQPRLDRVFVDLQKREIDRQMATLSDALLPFLIQNQIAAIHETMDAVLERQTNWKRLELRDEVGKLLYPIFEKPKVTNGRLIDVMRDIDFRGIEMASLAATVDFAEEMQNLRAEERLLISIGIAIVIVCIIFLAFFLEFVIIRRVRRLSVAADKLSSGDYSGKLPAVLKDEIGDLVVSFAAMRQNVFDKQKSLVEARTAAEDANRAKSKFLATMSHEIRTPMNGVISMTDFMLDTDVTPKQRHYADVIKESGEALLRIIDDILDFSRLESGLLELKEDEFDLCQIVDSVSSLLTPKAISKGISLDIYAPRGLCGHYYGDFGRVRQVLMNLLGNAVKFTESGYIQVEISASDCSGTTPRLKFEVKDTGIGIDPSEIPTLFDRFTQVETSLARRFEGSGLGLAISKHIVVALGGTLGVQSTPGGGSTFWFEVPLRRIDPSVPENVTFQSAEITGKSFVVLRDDRRDVFGNNIARTLEDCGAAHVSTMEPATFHAALVNDRSAVRVPDAVILDVFSFDTASVHILQAIRRSALFKSVPVLVVASAATEESFALDLASEDCSFATKPLGAGGLARALGTLVKSGSATAPAPSQADSFSAEKPKTLARALPLEVLVADDNAINQDVATALFENLGHKLTLATNGKEAFELARSRDFDIIFMDLQMPEMDGLEATKKIRDLPSPRSSVPIVAMTANAFKEDENRCYAIGMDRFLAKPVNRAKVNAVIQEVFSSATRC